MMKSLCRLQAMAALSAALAVPAQAAPDCNTYAQELATMVEAADAVRSRVDYLAPPEDAQAARHLAQLALVERDNGARLGALMAACGWPRRSVEGEEAARQAWLVVQQRGDDLPLQRQAVRQLELAALDGEAAMTHLATASDRLAVREGRPQRYGTQLRQVDACSWEYYPLDDIARVEARRQRIGLPTLADHKRSIDAMIITENCPAPRMSSPSAGR